MPQSQAEILALIATLTTGDIAEIEFVKDGQTKSRKVTVERQHSSEYSSGVYTIGGNVRPGNIAGGNLYTMCDEAYFQATPQQQTRRVVGLKTHRVLALRAA